MLTAQNSVCVAWRSSAVEAKGADAAGWAGE